MNYTQLKAYLLTGTPREVEEADLPNGHFYTVVEI